MKKINRYWKACVRVGNLRPREHILHDRNSAKYVLAVGSREHCERVACEYGRGAYICRYDDSDRQPVWYLHGVPVVGYYVGY